KNNRRNFGDLAERLNMFVVNIICANEHRFRKDLGTHVHKIRNLGNLSRLCFLEEKPFTRERRHQKRRFEYNTERVRYTAFSSELQTRSPLSTQDRHWPHPCARPASQL